MDTSKKTWVKSAFTQLGGNNSSLPLEMSETSTKRKRLKRSASFVETVQTSISNGKESPSAVPMLSNNWLDSFAPTHLEELAVHTKKVQELQNWFTNCNAVRKQHPAQVCLITGPSGAGKTATVRLLASNCNYQLQEWINPVDADVIATLGDQCVGNSYITSQLETFKSFLLRASRYKSLLSSVDKRLLLVEDFPNALLKDPKAFEAILADYANYGKSPLIFVVADSKSRNLNISYNLFTDQLKEQFRVTHISFNPIAATLMQKAMKRFCTLLRKIEYADTYMVPPQSVVDSIVICSQGDVRNALINLHFAALKDAPTMQLQPLNLQQQQSQKVGKVKQKCQTRLKSVRRDESITMLHALGRVLHPKLTEFRNLVHSPEEIVDHFTTEPKKFLDLVHANYLPHFTEMEHLTKATDGLSVADLILNEYREDTLALNGLNIGVRSVMVANTVPASGWVAVHGSKRLQMQTQRTTGVTQLLGVMHANISASLYAKDFRTFVELIAQKNRESEQVATTSNA